MVKLWHEFRDPIYTFVKLDGDERRVVDAEPVQRLRQIHQLALSYLVYPGATHRRFEHSLGVLEVAGRIFDVVTAPRNIPTALEEGLEELIRARPRQYWRGVLRMAALTHDIGHLPFSHGAEADLLPKGTKHETLTIALISAEPLRSLWRRFSPSPDFQAVAKIATGAEHFSSEPFNSVETILAEMITGDVFGADRIDYLLRDSLHAGVAYGRFDFARLIDSLRILPTPVKDGPPLAEPLLGIEEGGLRSAEALLLARYFMFNQVYLHRVRRVFDLHLRDFLVAFAQEQFPGGDFPTDPDLYLHWTDAEILSALRAAARDPDHSGHDPASCIIHRHPFKVLWEQTPDEAKNNPSLGRVIEQAAQAEFGPDAIRRDEYASRSALRDFPVLRRDGEVVSAGSLSAVLGSIPPTSCGFIFVDPEQHAAADRWWRSERARLLNSAPSEEE